MRQDGPQCPCTELLQEKRESWTADKIFGSAIPIIDRLLSDRLNMTPVFAEINRELTSDLHRHEFLMIVLDASRLWNEKSRGELFSAKEDLRQLKADIAKQADDLANLLDERSELSEKSGVSSDTLYSVVGAIHIASKSNGLYRSYLKTPLQGLLARYDLKYWPSLGATLRAIASDADQATVSCLDRSSEAAIDSAKNSDYVYLRGLFDAIDDTKSLSNLPSRFRLSDRTIAILMSTSLGLEEPRDEAYVKRARQSFKARVG